LYGISMALEDDQSIRALDQAILRAEAAAANLAVEIQGLRMARERRVREMGEEHWATAHQPLPPAEGHAVPARVAQWRAMSRTDAVLRMLHDSGGQLHRKDLTNRLIVAGRSGETIEAVSAALAYLARDPGARVVSMGHGFWQLAPRIEEGRNTSEDDEGFTVLERVTEAPAHPVFGAQPQPAPEIEGAPND
jgi:hypothetical protein